MNGGGDKRLFQDALIFEKRNAPPPSSSNDNN